MEVKLDQIQFMLDSGEVITQNDLAGAQGSLWSMAFKEESALPETTAEKLLYLHNNQLGLSGDGHR
jgi:hypothetical protein